MSAPVEEKTLRHAGNSKLNVMFTMSQCSQHNDSKPCHYLKMITKVQHTHHGPGSRFRCRANLDRNFMHAAWRVEGEKAGRFCCVCCRFSWNVFIMAHFCYRHIWIWLIPSPCCRFSLVLFCCRSGKKAALHQSTKVWVAESVVTPLYVDLGYIVLLQENHISFHVNFQPTRPRVMH